MRLVALPSSATCTTRMVRSLRLRLCSCRPSTRSRVPQMRTTDRDRMVTSVSRRPTCPTNKDGAQQLEFHRQRRSEEMLSMSHTARG